MTPLHAPDVLRDLAEGSPGPARDWANAQLALASSAPIPYLPSGFAPMLVALLAGPEDLVGTIARTIREDADAGGLVGAAALGRYGLLPDDPAPLVDAVRAGLGSSPARDLRRGMALASLGALDRDAFGAAARAAIGDPEGSWALPALVLSRIDDRDVVDAVARELARIVPSRPALVRTLVTWFGGPPFDDAIGLDPDAAAILGARAAGGAPRVGPPRGSRRRRAQKWVASLLEGATAPLPSLLHALYADRVEPEADLVALAAWLAGRTDEDPVTQVILRRAGCDGHASTAARASITADDAPALALAFREDPVAVGLPALATALRRTRAAPGLLDAALDRLLRDGEPPHDLVGGCGVLAGAAPDRIPDLLGDPATRAVGLALAEWHPTEEVLAALLEAPMPASPTGRVSYATALASMGDPATLPALSELARSDDPDLAAPLALAGSLLGADLVGASVPRASLAPSGRPR